VSQGQANSPNVANLGPDVNYVADTGPLLCLGGSKILRDLYKAHCYGKTHWVEAVRAELANQSRGIGPRAQAAKTYDGRGASWLPVPISFTTQDDQDITPIRDRLKVLGEAKAKVRGQTTQSSDGAHLGEAQSILHARRHGHTLLSHDDDARGVAGEHAVPAATLVDLGRHFVSERVATPKQLSNEFLTLRADGIDIGEPISGPLDLRPMPNPRVPPQRPRTPPAGV
jgi:hypothetical protein